ncbi:MAG: dTMP kinase [Acidimicrobiaceae bacterium]|jgi:dTMP kinase
MTFVAFEGGEGTGKSTQARLLAERLDAVLTHEPGATTIGVELRRLALGGQAGELDPRAEALVMAADRAQHVAEVIAPALAAGRHVVTDRYYYSSLAYQGYGRGLPLDGVRALSVFAGAPEADLVVLLTVPPAVRATRLGGDLDRIESAGDAFHSQVEEGFLALAAADPGRWVVIDASGSVDEVADAVWSALEGR